ncbi:MAG: hypothetical protein LBG98_00955 [Puniceicoccales bacterium]|nr:hypothetical protein [Puniceicoccales bacterium]
MKAPALHFSLPQRRQTKREERKMEWKRGRIRDLFLYSTSAPSLFSLPDFDDTL